MRGGTEKTRRYRDYFDLQLRFAQAAAQKTSTPLAEAVLLYTNFHRRFGLGDTDASAPCAPLWQQYAVELSTLDTHRQRAEFTQAFYAQAPDEKFAFPERVFGCFYFDADEQTGIIRPHFNRDFEGPLSRPRIGAKQRELKEMFAFIRRRFPAAQYVEGQSWLYGTQAYRRIFPEQYVRSPAIMEDATRFQGTSRWGQFLDRNEEMKPDLKDRFLHNIDRLNPNRLWEAFPLPSFRVRAPIDVFYAYYEMPHTMPPAALSGEG